MPRRSGMTFASFATQRIHWMAFAFFAGVVLHSAWPERAFPHVFLMIVMIVSVGAFYLITHPVWRICALCILFFVGGVWRYDVVRPTQPRGLVPFSVKGLAYGSGATLPMNPSDPRYWIKRSRSLVRARAYHLFHADEAALLTGILYGERLPDPSLRRAFRETGLLHLVAVSGSNVTLLVGFGMTGLLRLRCTRRQAFAGTSLLLVWFVVFVSPSASVVRAALMGWLIEAAPLCGRIVRPSRLLLVAAIVFVWWRPWSLLFDPSFALSFCAMGGLLYLSPLVERYFMWLPFKTLRMMMATTISATVCTSPYAAWAFGGVQMLGLATNMLAIPLVPWIMASGSLALLLPWTPFVLMAQGFLRALLAVSHISSVTSWGTWDHLIVPWWEMIGWYGLIGVVVWKWRAPEKLSTASPYFCRSDQEKEYT